MTFLLNKKSVAMIPSAGFGSRLGSLTLQRPKPLIELCGVTMLERACLHLIQAGFEHIAINTHYLATQIHNFTLELKEKFSNTNFHIFHEPELLDIGGGIKKVAFDLGVKELLIFNSDTFLYNESNPLQALLRTWDLSSMDALIYLKSKHNINPPLEKADFNLDLNNKLVRSDNLSNHEYLYCGISIYKTDPLTALEESKFHIMTDYVFPKMHHEHKFYGLEIDSEYLDIGTLENLDKANKIVSNQLKKHI